MIKCQAKDRHRYAGDHKESKYKSEKLPKNFILTFKCTKAINGILSLLVDTGAAVSIIKTGGLHGETTIKKENKIHLTGIGVNSLTTEGTSMLNLELCGVNYTHQFHLIKNNQLTNITSDGILGRDFLDGKFIINCVENEIKIKEIGLVTEEDQEHRNYQKEIVTKYASDAENIPKIKSEKDTEEDTNLLKEIRILREEIEKLKMGVNEEVVEERNIKKYENLEDIIKNEQIDLKNKTKIMEMEIKKLKDVVIKNETINVKYIEDIVRFEFKKLIEDDHTVKNIEDYKRNNNNGNNKNGIENYDIIGKGIVTLENDYDNNLKDKINRKESYDTRNMQTIAKVEINKVMDKEEMKTYDYETEPCTEKDLAEVIKNWRMENEDGKNIQRVMVANKTRGNEKLFFDAQCTGILPPRSENMVEVKTQSTQDCICIAEEIENGVFVGNALVRPQNGKVFIGIINTNTCAVDSSKYRPKFEQLHDYEPENENADMNSIERINLLKDNVRINSEISAEHKRSIMNICEHYSDLFFLPGDKLTYTNSKTLSVPLKPGTEPINRKQYRLPEAYKNEAKKQIESMLRDGIIERSTSPFNFPVIIVPKKGVDKNGKPKYRLCVDFRLLNQVCVPISYPLPRIEQILEGLGKSRYFTSLDLASGYHQITVEKEDRAKLAFSMGFGHYQYCRAPFGLKNLPYHFQALLNTVLTGLQGVKCFVYLDDVIIFARDVEEHNEKLIEVFERFRTHNLKLQPDKCQFLMTEIVYLGHICSENGIKPDTKLTSVIKEYPAPKNIKQVQSFLGLANYYRKFIKGFSQIASPINGLLKKGIKFDWSTDCEEAFIKLKGALTSAPVLTYPDFEKDFEVICDASNFSLGAILEQEGRVVYYASRTLNDTERRYSTTEREMLAIIWATKTFRCYLLGRKFNIYTDHQALAGWVRANDTTSRMLRWAQKLSEYNYTIIYKPGKKNTNADCLSRLESNNIEQDEMVPSWAITRAQKHQNDNGALKDKDIENKNEEQNCQKIEKEINEIQEITDLAEREIILKDYHDGILAGHFGVKKTIKKIKTKYRWHGMCDDVKNYVRKCEKCQRNKITRATKMPMVISDVSRKPFEKIYVDIVGPLPTTEHGANKYILSMMDDLTRFVDFVAIPNQEAGTVARVLFEQILSRYTIPKKMVTDQGAQFTGEVFKSLCKLLRIKKLQTTGYHPQSNHVERVHSSLGNYLRNFVDKKPGNWDLYVRTAAHAFNNTENEASGYTPMQLLFGFASEIPTNIKSSIEPQYNYEDYLCELRHKLQTSFEIARKRLLEAKLKSKKYYDKNQNIRIFHINDMILLKNPARSNKLDEIWQGPYKIIEVHENARNVTILVRNKKRRVHMNRLKIFYNE